MATTVYSIDPTHTAVEFAVKHMMFTTVRGRFNALTGTIVVDSENPGNSRVDVEIDAASIDTGVADRDAHLRSGDFLDTAAFPKITFHSTSVEGPVGREGAGFAVVGNLTIHGRTLPVTLNATFEGVGKDPWGNHRAGFAARTELDRRQWGLTWNQALETGGVLVAHTIRIEIEAEAVRQESQQAAA